MNIHSKAAASCLILSLFGCGGGESGSETTDLFSAKQKHPCDGVDLGFNAPSKLYAGLTIEQANNAIGCPAEKVADNPITYTWFDGEVDHFGVNLDENEQVIGIFVFDDWINCPGQSFTDSHIQSLIGDGPMTTPISLADSIMQCKGELKAIDFKLTTGGNSGVVQYLNDKGKEINVIFINDIILSATLHDSLTKGKPL